MTSILPKELVDTMAIFESPKFMATKDSLGEPNAAIVTSWTVYEGNTLVYGDFLTYKTRRNLEEGNSELGLLVMTTDLDSWMIRADFESFHKSDDVYEFIATTPFFRYNQYTNARSAGLATATSVGQNQKISKLSVLSTYLKARLAKRKVPVVETEEGNMPRNVERRFSQMAAIKALAYVDEAGYPVIFPNFGMIPASSNRISVNRDAEKRRGLRINDGQRVAVSLVTLEPAAFQLKGTFREINESTGYIELDRVYTCSLPRPGERVDIPMLSRES
ncbi:MAG: hypothetical protein ACFE8Z_01935 [Candidatus Hermodarchaeota archaeon]